MNISSIELLSIADVMVGWCIRLCYYCKHDDVNDDVVQVIDQGMLLEMAFDET